MRKMTKTKAREGSKAMADTLRRATVAIILLISTTTAHSQSKSSSYYCVAEFSGGGWYNSTTKRGEGSSLRTNDDNSKFILRMTFIDQANNYNVSITPWGSNAPADCRGSEGSKTVTAAFGVLMCTTSPIQMYVFNPFTNRFFRIYTAGYINGLDNDDTPYIAGGACTKIE
jgi:hypothetical protein